VSKIYELMGIHPRKALAYSDDQVRQVYNEATPEVQQQIALNAPAFVAMIGASVAVSEVTVNLQGAVGTLETAKQAIQSAVPVMGVANAAKLASDVGAQVLVDQVRNMKSVVLTQFLNSEV